MLEYIYFVKCPGCEDEHFDFFNDAKDFAMCLLSKKPIITQVEVDRNDFGECVNSTDLGTVWSWEEMMKETEAEPAKCVFTKDDLECTDYDAEFDALDNSVEPTEDRKPVPEGMTIKDLVEAMEENEDEVECVVCEELYDKEDCRYDEKHGWICEDCDDETVECTWCEELYDRSECRKEADMGWLCGHCEAAIKSRGERLTFIEGSYWDFLDESKEDAAKKPVQEAMDPHDLVELEYPSLTVTLYGPKRDVDDWDEFDHTDSFVFLVPKVEVATAIWENWITDEDVVDVEGGLEALEDDIAWEKFLETHFDTLFEKYNKQILNHFEDEATEDFRERAQEEYDMDNWSAAADRAYDEWRDEKYFGEGAQKSGSKPFLEELEEAADYRNRLVDCPECGVNESFDHETGICINCGFNI